MNQLAEHLRFYQELGVTGINRDPKWRRREDGTTNLVYAVPEVEAVPVTIARTTVEALAQTGDSVLRRLLTRYKS